MIFICNVRYVRVNYVKYAICIGIILVVQLVQCELFVRNMHQWKWSTQNTRLKLKEDYVVKYNVINNNWTWNEH